MTIDERLERLVERHEALAQTVELMAATTNTQTAQIASLIQAIDRDAENIRSLARIAEAHEHRISISKARTRSKLL